jgi:sulfur-carrier protein
MPVVRLFAAAEEAAGSDRLDRSESGLAALRAGLSADFPALGVILPRCSVLVDGSRADDDAELRPDAVVDVLPPFAGG